ncbi:MAG: glycoside hydrolase family 13 [Ferruginibacter sp.]
MTTKKVQFTLPAEIVAGAERGILVGEFNDWNVEEGIWLEKAEDGSLRTELVLTGGKTYQYRYLLSDGRWVNDHREKTWPDAYGVTVENCLVAVPAATAEVITAATKTVKVKKATTAKKVKTVAKKEPAKADDLTKIEGIGKHISALLKKEGIITFNALGKTAAKKLKTILEAAGPKYNVHNPASWPKQAKLAAAEKWSELEALQASLKGGK